MSYGLPDDWFVEETGETLILDQEKVAAEIARLTAERDEAREQIRKALNDSAANRAALQVLYAEWKELRMRLMAGHDRAVNSERKSRTDPEGGIPGRS